jgi:predicted O-methyltransferase YrrM
MHGYVAAAALGAAMELGVFWLLAKEPLPAADVARSLGIPLNRCHHWLEILCSLGPLDSRAGAYAPARLAREAILAAQSQDTWAFQAGEERESSFFMRDLALNIGKPVSAWQTRKEPPPDYLQRIQEDPAFAARFTRKLYEIHSPLAERLADLVDISEVRSLLDLGGGSGVVSFALLRKQDNLTSVVVDVQNVCEAGREIARENRLEHRMTYQAADLLQDELPAGFDLVILCDVGTFAEELFGRIYAALNPRGRLLVVDKFAPVGTSAAPSRLTSAFLSSLQLPAQSIDFTTAEMVQTQLGRVGFRETSVTPLPPRDRLPWNLDWTMLESRKPANTA